MPWEVVNGVGVDGVGGIFPFSYAFFPFFYAFFPLFLRFSLLLLKDKGQTTAIYCKNGEFHSDPVCTDPVQNFPNIACRGNNLRELQMGDWIGGGIRCSANQTLRIRRSTPFFASWVANRPFFGLVCRNDSWCRESPGKPNQRKGQNEKFMNFSPIFGEFWCFSLGKQARFTKIELLF